MALWSAHVSIGRAESTDSHGSPGFAGSYDSPGSHGSIDAEPGSARDGATTLADVLRESVEVNLDLRAEERIVAAGRADVLLSIARLLPQARASYLASIIDEDRAIAGQGDSPERVQSGRAELSQVLFDERLLADVTVRKHVLAAREAVRDQIRLDVIQGTGVAFLESLRARASQRIQDENERVTRENLKVAETRRKVGSAAAGEVYRWQSQLARDRRSAIFALRDRRQSEIALNRILNRLPESPLDLDSRVLSPITHVFADVNVRVALDTSEGFRATRDWLAGQALAHAPELREIAEQLEARRRVLASAERAYWAPTLSLNGVYDRAINRDGGGSDLPSAEDDEEWTLGLRASIPLFQGGRRLFDLRQAREQLSELRIRQDATRRRIDEQVRTSAFQVWSSLLAIELSKTAAEAAARNLELVTLAYSRGTVSVVDLLDAQGAATTSADEAENSTFDHLIDLLALQRSLGRFWMFLSEEERGAERADLHRRLGIN